MEWYIYLKLKVLIKDKFLSSDKHLTQCWQIRLNEVQEKKLERTYFYFKTMENCVFKHWFYPFLSHTMIISRIYFFSEITTNTDILEKALCDILISDFQILLR